jgi:TRAP-type C4-dicarboxylate transport system substrate-binding protein
MGVTSYIVVSRKVLNMKHMHSLVSAAVLAAMVVAAPASAKTLKGAYFVSPTHPVGQGYAKLAEDLERESKGDLKLRVFPGESLLGAKAISDGVRDEVSDIGHVVMTYTPAYYPHGIVINDLSMVGTNDMAAAMAVTELFLLQCPACLTESAKQNQIPFSMASTPGYLILANGDFNSPEKIKLKKLRAAGSLWDRFCQSIGAVAVNMPTAGLYEAMSRGTVDGALYAIGGLKSLGLADATKQVINLNTGSFRAASLYSMNINSWNALSVEERTTFLKVVPAAVVKTTRAYLETDEEGFKIAKEKNIPFVEPHPDLLRIRNEFVVKDQELTVKNAVENLHLAAGEKFVADYNTLYNKWEKLVAPLGKDDAKIAELLYQEVYSKIDPKNFGRKD